MTFSRPRFEPLRRSLSLRALLVAAASLGVAGCDAIAFGGPKPGASSTAAPTPPAAAAPVVAAPAPKPFEVPFAGTYRRTAKVSQKNGRRLASSAGGDLATLTVAPGLVTFYVEYKIRGGATANVTQTYAFKESDVRPVSGGFDVPLEFLRMEPDRKDYSPDSRNPSLQVRKIGPRYRVGLLITDRNGVSGGQEFD